MKLKLWVKVLLAILLVGVGYIGYQMLFNNEPTSIVNKEENFSEIVKFVKNNGIYDEKYEEEYKNIKYNEKPIFKEVLSVFLDKGYKGEEINYIMELSDKNINKLKNTDYIDISNYYTFKNFNVDNISRYNKYKESHEEYEYKNIVTYVNIKLDLPVYTDTVEVKEPDSLLVLVNKYNSLPKNYKPTNLVAMKGYYEGQDPSLREETKSALEDLQKASKEEIGIRLLPTTAFRDYNFQNTLYTNYKNKDGVEAADTYSARPGYSDHQTGLAVDLKNPERSNVRLSDSDYEWLHNNAYKYGFIIRFPKGKEFITGYQFENWHIRYVGKDVAKIIYENDLTLEEYIDLYVTEY